MELSGHLDAFPPGHLLQWAHHERRTGALVVRRGSHEKRIYFRKGELVACLTDDPAEFYGQYLLLYGYLDEATLMNALTSFKGEGKRLGAALVEMGVLSLQQMQETLRRQIEDAVCDLFLWRHGVFFFESTAPPEEEILPEPIHMQRLVLEGTRWIDEYARIRTVLVHDHVVLSPGPRRPGGDPSPVEARILAAVDGRRTLAEIRRLVGGSRFRVLEGAFHLCLQEVLDIQTVGEEGGEQTTGEISVLDLLLEQAAEEQILFARRHLAIPLDLLERFVPIWTHGAPEIESRHETAAVQDFYRRIDGQTRLRDLLSTDPRQRSQELDVLVLQLRRGSLALLPATLRELEGAAAARRLPALRRWWRRFRTRRD